MKIKIAQSEDIEQLTALLAVLFNQEAEFTPAPERQRQGLSMIIQSPDIGEIVVIKKDGKIIGMVNLLYTISTALGSRVAWLEDMVIQPDYRNNGTGTTLIQAAIEHAKQRGCQRITLLTDHNNIDAHRFYERNGFQHSSMVAMRLQPITPQ